MTSSGSNPHGPAKRFVCASCPKRTSAYNVETLVARGWVRGPGIQIYCPRCVVRAKKKKGAP